jgi:uncharacterized repeat protein (TIGR02543 family)
MLQNSKSNSVPETKTGSTNVAGLESLMSRANPVKRLCFALIAAVLIFGGCEEDKEFTVTFDSRGGSAVAAQTVKEGGKLTEPKEPARDGYAFDAWYKEEAFTAAWNFDTDPVKANITLYAKWIEKGNADDDVYLLTEWTFAREDEDRVYRFEYDAQNRLKKMEEYYGNTLDGSTTFTYNSADDLISVVKVRWDGESYTDTYIKDGNKITSTYEEDGDSWIFTAELNAQGRVEKFTQDHTGGDGHWCKDVRTVQYSGQNVSRWTQTYTSSSESDTEPEIYTFTYDDKKSPFYYCNTPQWLMVYIFYWYFGIHNNIKTINYNNNEETSTSEYEYNDAGFPLTRKETRRWNTGGEYEFTETFSYGNPSGQKSAVRAVSAHSSVGASTGNNPREALDRLGGRRFGGRPPMK